MNRPETTKWLSKLLEEHIDPKNDPRVYWAKEITFDYGSVSPIRVDYMQFKPVNNSVSGIEKEARRYDELMVMLRAGIISDLRLQQQFTLQESYMTETGERVRAVRYTADFSYRFGGKLVVEDVKSKPTRTKEYLRNRKFMRSKFGVDVQEI